MTEVRERQRTRTAVVVGTDPLAIEKLSADILREGFALEVLSSVAAARQRLEKNPADILVVDSGSADSEASGLLEWALREGRASFALSCSPVPQAGRRSKGETEDDAEDRARWRASYSPSLVGEAPALLAVVDLMRNVADTDCPVLVTGESGTGKELVARAIHDASPRCDQNFVALNCAAIPETLIEAELFGHAKGAFTGAHAAREGRFVVADGGTLFLDEIGDMPLSLQAKLLRVLQERVVTALGDSHGRPVDVRVVAATHQDLEVLVADGKFRADLFYRLNVIPVKVPALRDRKDDILMLARHFLFRANRRLGRNVLGFEPGADELLLEHTWPGNVRELQNLVERLVVLKGRGSVSRSDLAVHLPRVAAGTGTAFPAYAPEAKGTDPAGAAPAASAPGTSLDLKRAQDDLERKLIQEALSRTGGNRTEAAALLGLNRTTLVEKLRKIA